jgi:GDP-L-fucose synthase
MTRRWPAGAKVCVAGIDTLIGRALVARLQRDDVMLVGATPADAPDLRDRRNVHAFFEAERPSHVFLAAGRSAGIGGNQRFPADLMLDNLLVEAHVIDAALRSGTRRLLYLASSCSYPKLAPQPMTPTSLMAGALEPTSAPYAVAKIAGIKLCEAYRRQHGADFIPAIPGDAFGPGDDFGPEDSHVVAALIRRMHEAKIEGRDSIEIWGSGNQRREFIFVADLADACVHVMHTYEADDVINIGSGEDISIRELAEAVQAIVGFAGTLHFDIGRPDGMPRKALNVDALRGLGWHPRTALPDALRQTYQWYLTHEVSTVQS